jgi:chaperonin GroES
MNVKPLHDHILIKRLSADEVVRGGIIIPDSAKEKPMEGKVISVGSGKVLDDGKVQALVVKPGDSVLVGKYSGTEIKIEGEDHVILREDDVLGVIE